jgi:hypothetical protein
MDSITSPEGVRLPLDLIAFRVIANPTVVLRRGGQFGAWVISRYRHALLLLVSTVSKGQAFIVNRPFFICISASPEI